MKIVKIACRNIRIPLTLTFTQSSNSAAFSDSIILSVELSNGLIGYGECCPRTYVTGEDATTVMQDVLKISTLLESASFQSLDDIRELIEQYLPGKVGTSTICAVETALLDVFSKHSGLPITALLGITWPEQIKYSGVVPMLPVAALPGLLSKLRYFNFEDIKLKIGSDLSDSLARINIIKRIFGENIQLRVDVNCAWNFEEAQAQLPALCEAGARVFEQIFPPEEEENWARMTAHFDGQAELMVDESVTTLESAQRLIEEGIGNRFNLKISKQGGIFRALKIRELANSNGIPCQLGAHYGETSILTTCGVLFYAAAGQLAAMEGAFGKHLLSADICTNVLQFDQDACITSPERFMAPFGLGYEVSTTLLDKFTVSGIKNAISLLK